MTSRLLIPIITAATALGSGVASANATYWAQNGLLLEVSADPRDGSDFVQTNAVHADSLELVALGDNVRLRGLTVRFSDGRTFSQPMQTIRVGERVRVDLPANCDVIQNVQLDYGRQLVDRTPARLQIIPHGERAYAYQQPAYTPSYTYQQPSYTPPQQPVIRDHRQWATTQPAYVVQPAPQPTTYFVQPAPQPTTYVVQPAPQPTTYVVQPTASWSGYIRASFRF